MNEKYVNENLHANLKKYIYQNCFEYKADIPANPYERPIDHHKVSMIDGHEIKASEVFSEKNKIIHQILFNIYEQDMLFLDKKFDYQKKGREFENFYDPAYVSCGKSLKPVLEDLAFNFLKNELFIPDFSKERLRDYLEQEIIKYEAQSNELCNFIDAAKQPASALKYLLIQMSPDFLTEASPLARTVIGSFGAEQSEMMKVLIDEYGYGIHAAKHSTLFENLMNSVGLNNSIHHYYHDYLATSFMLINYFHFLTSNKINWFKYLGALYYTEASIPHFNKRLSQLFKKHFKSADVRYFDEHAHIDKFHRQMVLDKIIIPSVGKYGNKIISDILFGFESARWILSAADHELIMRIKEKNGVLA